MSFLIIYKKDKFETCKFSPFRDKVMAKGGLYF